MQELFSGQQVAGKRRGMRGKQVSATVTINPQTRRRQSEKPRNTVISSDCEQFAAIAPDSACWR
jgi:hypothetical protein